MRTARLSVLNAVLLSSLLAMIAACGQSQQKQGGPGQGPAPEVTVVTIAPEKVTLTTVLAGRTSAYLISEVRPQVGGIVQKRLFREGSDVRAGELLYQIDPATYQAAYDNAKATLAKAEANAQPARLKAERYANLVKVRAVSTQDNDDAQAANQQAQAEVTSARAALDTARINLSYTRVTSPIAGRIGKSSVTPGALVTASQATALTTVQKFDPVYVDVTQSSSEVMRLKREFESGRLKKAADGGAKVKLLLDDGTPYPIEGTLQFSDISVDMSTGSVNLRAVFPNPKHDLLPGLYVRAVLEEGVEAEALLAPQTAVMRDAKGQPQVMLVTADGTVEMRSIVTGRVVGDKWQVLSGLAAGDRVITEGLQKVRPGAKVQPVEAQAAQQNATEAAPAKPEAKPAAKPEAKPDAKPEAKPDSKPEAKPDAKPAAKPEAKPDAKPDAKPEGKTDAKPVAKKREPLVYSPPKDQPWPNSNGSVAPAAQPQEQNPAQPEHKSEQ